MTALWLRQEPRYDIEFKGCTELSAVNSVNPRYSLSYSDASQRLPNTSGR